MKQRKTHEINLMGNHRDLTQYEKDALKFAYNLADAHTHQSQSSTQKDIIANLPKLWYIAEHTKQHDADRRFIQAFFRIRRQPSALSEYNNTLLTYSSSISIAIVANYLARKKIKVALIEPCFDNLPDLLKHFGVTMIPLREEWLHYPNRLYKVLEKHLDAADALMIVDPNNPTGHTLFSQEGKAFIELIRFVKEKNKLLIFDFCFSLFLQHDPRFKLFDIYKLLSKNSINYLIIEDTGKIWPMLDIKASILSCSRDLYIEIYNIHSSYLLNVSPFVLTLLTEYIKDSENDKFASVHSLLELNRKIAKKKLNGSILAIQESQVNVSVLWCKITDPSLTSTELQRIIQQHGVYVLSGNYFFWHNRDERQEYIRIALARNTDMFISALKPLRRALDNYRKIRKHIGYEKNINH